jgi:uncharacterized phage protein gp47/JayE
MSNIPSIGPAGLTVLTTEEVRENLQEAIRSAFGAATAIGPNSVFGQLIDVFAVALGEMYDLVQSVYDGTDPDSAQGIQQDHVATMSGLTRESATYSSALLTLSGTPATVIPALSRVRIGADGSMFELDAEATIGGGGTVTDVASTSLETGEIEAPAGTIDTIVDAVAGWTGVTNPADALEGNVVETDSEVIRRRQNSLGIGGGSTDHTLRAQLQQLSVVDGAYVIENKTLVTDSKGVPGNSLRCVLWPTGLSGDDIAPTLWAYRGQGVLLDGTESAVVTDSQNKSQTVYWSYATTINIYCTITVTQSGDGGYPSGGDALVQTAALNYIQSLDMAADVEPAQISAAILAEVPGIAKLVIKLGTAPTPTAEVAIPVDVDEIASTQSSWVIVT